MVVFLTGTKHDAWLYELFTLERESVLDDGFLSVLRDSRGLLPRLSFQTKHPRTLSMQRSYHAVLNKIVERSLA